MELISAVSETAFITLKSRVIEAEKEHPVISDPVGRECLERLRSQLQPDIRKRVLDRRLPASLTRHIALRARKYDAEARAFIQQNPNGLVVSLGCGFDTRYWRVSDQPWNYVEIDLPQVIAAKKQVLGDRIRYPMIGCSVLEESWVAELQAKQRKEILFLAEGLLMYLPQAEVIHLFDTLSQTFSNSVILFEVVHRRYTSGLWKKGVEARMKRNLGTAAGAEYQFGVRDAREVESYGQNIAVLEEWSYFEDQDIKPGFLRLFRNFKFVSRTQWTIKAGLG